MVLSYLKKAVKRSIVTYLHPHFSRSVLIDDQVCPLDTYENTSYDIPVTDMPPSVTDQIKSGLDLKPMGSMPETSGLNAVRVASAFIRQFNALAEPESVQEPASAAPAAPAAPAVPVAPAE